MTTFSAGYLDFLQDWKFKMRLERWYWLLACCLISLGIHLEIAFHSPPIHAAVKVIQPTEIEVALLPLTDPPKPAETPKKPPEQPRPNVSQPPKPTATEKAEHNHISDRKEIA